MDQQAKEAPVWTWGQTIGEAAGVLRTLLDGGCVPDELRTTTRTLLLDLDDIAFEMSRD